MFTVTRDQSVLYKAYVFEIYWGTHFPHQKLFWHQHVSTSSFLSVTRECMACSAEGGEHSLDSLNCCRPCPHRGPSDLQQKTEKGEILVPERRQDYFSNHGTSPFRSDWPGAAQLRVSESVVAFGFVGVGWLASRRGLRSLGQAPS